MKHMVRSLVLALAALTAAAQTFVQMSDPQFGMYASGKGFERETANFEFAIAAANRLKPAFVVVTGDLMHTPGDDAQIAEYQRIAAKLDPSIKLYNVPGNHDEGRPLTRELAAKYRERFGPNYYAFREGAIAGLVVDSNLLMDPRNAPEEAVAMEEWLRAELAKARTEGLQPVVFQHHPIFQKTADEPAQSTAMPLATRRRYLEILHEGGVKYVFAGHDHRSYEAKDGDLTMVVSGAVGKPLGGGKSGFRVITASPQGLEHRYYDFGDLPQ